MGGGAVHHGAHHPLGERGRHGRQPGPRQAVTEYLATEVLWLTTEQRRFLLRTSVLDELSAGPCQALAGDRAGVLLRELVRSRATARARRRSVGVPASPGIGFAAVRRP